MVSAVSVFLPLLGAFACVALTGRSARAARAVAMAALLVGAAATLVLTFRLGAWDLMELDRAEVLVTGVGAPPLSIDLNVTAGGALAALAAYAAALLSLPGLTRERPKAAVLLLPMLTASMGLMHATDLFNSFVFLEIGTITAIGLIVLDRSTARFEAAMKAALVGGLVTVLFLLAVALVYRSTGELRLQALSGLAGAPAVMVSALMLTVVMTEMKAFPLSGWGLDLYQGSSPAVAGAYGSVWTIGVLLWSVRVLQALPLPGPDVLVYIGAAGLLLGQLAGLRASSPGRMLGYSTAGYASLLLLLAGAGEPSTTAATVLLLAVFGGLGKLVLFLSRGGPAGWKGSRSPLLLLAVLTLAGVPPMPVFWAKVHLLRMLSDNPPVMAITAAGLLFEGVYLLRYWAAGGRRAAGRRRHSAVTVLAACLPVAGAVWLGLQFHGDLSLAGGMLPSRTIALLFGGVFAAGTLLTIPGVLGGGYSRGAVWPWLLAAGAALAAMPAAGNRLTLYVLWELATVASVMLVARGERRHRGTWWLSVFGLASGYALLAATVLPPGRATALVVLAAVAALLKMGQAGAHLWTVRAYADAPPAGAAFLGGSVSKAGLMLLMMLAAFGGPMDPLPLLAWTGALTALGMAVMASLSGDYRRVLAFASVSQLGYAVMGVALWTVTGWTAASYQMLNHFLFKTVLFLGAASVILRTGTSEYDRLGGLVRRMPLTFAFTLVAVIGFSGVPPLSGFGSKWLLYMGLIESGWLPVAVVAMFASVVSFLYAFRLLHSVFLGQLHTANRRVREAPLSLLVPQAIVTAGLMALSFRPTLLLSRLLPSLSSVVGLGGETPVVSGTTVVTSLGYWDAWSVGMMVMGLFGFAFLLYWLSGHRPRHVGQLDIGYAGEVPRGPEELHHAGDFFRHVRRALGFLPALGAGRLFGWVSGAAEGSGDAVRALFTGDGRTYLLHSVAFMLACYVLMRGGL